MKKPLRGATLALLAVSPFAYLACSDDSSGGGGTFTLPTIDAAVPVADAATVVDAGVDVPDADAAAPTTATVHVVTARKAPEANAKVVFYDAAGTVLGTETTDANGAATHTMPAGGSITAVFGTAEESSLVTIQGVQPGDALTMLDPARVFNVTFAITAPALPQGATHLSVRLGSCERGFATGQSVFLSVQYCGHPADVATVVLTALNDSNVVVASTAKAGVTLIENTEDPNTNTAVTFAGPWVTTTTGTTTVTNVPTSGAFTNSNPVVQVGASTGTGIDLATSIDFFGSPAQLTNRTYTGSFSRLLPGAAFAQNEFDFIESPTDGEVAIGLATRAIVTRGALAATTTIDFSAPLPAIGSTTVTGGATPAVTWTSTAPLTGTKAIETYFTWFTDTGVGSWLVYAPPTATSIAPPSLPADLAAFGPTAASQYSLPPLVVAIDATFLPSYATVRASAAALSPDRGLEDGAGSTVAPALPVDGMLKVTAFSHGNLD